ncbi:MAG: hypothetical protein KDK90_24050 [Leptospiraceae bacterium]|nr:hypothetical protein [Leptospiraceae bacterium]
MMVWNYRVILENEAYSIHEVFYNEKGKIISCSAEPLELTHESIEGLKLQLEGIQEALKLPILNIKDLPKPSKPEFRRGTPLSKIRSELGLEKEKKREFIQTK